MAWQYADWQQRVLAERYELSCKIERLKQFSLKPEFGAMKFADRNLLEQQCQFMDFYLETLSKRIRRFKKVRVRL